MADSEKAEPNAADVANQKSLELLYDYTKFHIGVYLTLTAAYITVATAEIKGKPILNHVEIWLVWPAVVAFMVAGIAGGVIASSLTQTSARSAKQFLEEAIGPWEIKRIHFRARTWTWIEHTTFWIGLFLAVLSICLR